jgi:hypothetical protein
VSILSLDRDGLVFESFASTFLTGDSFFSCFLFAAHDERRRLAHKHGYKTIGEFEELMYLNQAMDRSEYSKPYANERIYPKELAGRTKGIPKDSKPAAVVTDENEEENSDNDEKVSYERQTSAATDELSYDELLQIGGQILMLHDEILHRVFAWLPVDAYATLAVVSPHWKNLTRTESVYQRLCERLYLNQSKRRQLHVSRFGGSYRTMLEERPRVRAAGGCYILKYAHIKQIQRDMWTEVSRSQNSMYSFFFKCGGKNNPYLIAGPFERFLWVPSLKPFTIGTCTFKKMVASFMH